MALASLIVTVAMLQLLTVNGVFGRLGRRRPSLPDHLEMPQPAKWTELSHSTWACTDELEELEVDSALAALDHDSRASSGSKARERLETEKKSIQRRKQCVVKNMCVDGKGTACADQSVPEGTKVDKKDKKGGTDNGLTFFFFSFLGAFILSSGDLRNNLPKINMISADKSADTYWQPRVKYVRGGIKAHYVDNVLFVRGLYSPFHLSHYLYNSVLPLMRFV